MKRRSWLNSRCLKETWWFSTRIWLLHATWRRRETSISWRGLWSTRCVTMKWSIRSRSSRSWSTSPKTSRLITLENPKNSSLVVVTLVLNYIKRENVCLCCVHACVWERELCLIWKFVLCESFHIRIQVHMYLCLIELLKLMLWSLWSKHLLFSNSN